jgi:hypothetical protein
MLLYNGRIEVCLGPPARPMGPKAPGGGKGPAPGPASATRWDPDPRWASRSGRRRPVQGLGRGDPAEGRGGERGLPLARVRVASQGSETAETELSSVVGLPQGFRGTGR